MINKLPAPTQTDTAQNAFLSYCISFIVDQL